MHVCDECGKETADPIYVDTIGYGDGPNLVFCSWKCLVAYGMDVVMEASNEK